MAKNSSFSNKLKQESNTAQESVQSVSRALDVLEAFPTFGPEIGLTSMASHLDLNKATTYRLLQTLEARGYVERSPEGRKYRLGVRAFELGSYFQNQLDIRRLALPYLNEMVEETQEAAFLCVREGDEALCIERVEAEREVNIFTLRVGGRQPLHCGAAPRALLTGLDECALAEYASRTGLPARTPETITTVEALLEDVQLTRQHRYVVSMNDVVVGIAAVGSPVRDYSGRVVASLSLSGLSNRYEPAHISELADIVIATAGRLSRQMGFREEE